MSSAYRYTCIFLHPDTESVVEPSAVLHGTQGSTATQAEQHPMSFTVAAFRHGIPPEDRSIANSTDAAAMETGERNRCST